jgi:putative alpha-1,2-mannosidase
LRASSTNFLRWKLKTREKTATPPASSGSTRTARSQATTLTYLYACIGAPAKTQRYVSKVMNELYNNTSSGYAGNEDCGQMSSWYVFGSMGFYPVNPVGGEYVLGAPLLEEAVVTLPKGKTFAVKAHRTSPDEIYVQSVTLNGKPHKEIFIRHEDIMRGGTLELKMGKKKGSF